MVIISKEKGTRKISMITDRNGLPTLLLKILELQPYELNDMNIDSSVRSIDGVKQWTWRLNYSEPPKKKK